MALAREAGLTQEDFDITSFNHYNDTVPILINRERYCFDLALNVFSLVRLFNCIRSSLPNCPREHLCTGDGADSMMGAFCQSRRMVPTTWLISTK